MPVEQRVAVFDNDGTLWCEKPVAIQLRFILRRLQHMAEAERELRDRQPWKAAYERDSTWFDAIVAAHYAGDDSGIPTLVAGVLGAYAGVSVEDFEAEADDFLRNIRHPTLDRTFVDCAYVSDGNGGTITHVPQPDYLNDGAEKPIRAPDAGAGFSLNRLLSTEEIPKPCEALSSSA